MKNDNYKIAAVVVTYNRLGLLKECMQSLREQIRKPDEIIVVNNSSTDGTLEWLNEQNDLTVITQENSGSAGGQYTGIKNAYEKGYDWVWCFDDDCFAKKDALQMLLSQVLKIERCLYNSLIISNINNNQLAFGLFNSKNKSLVSSANELNEELFEDDANPFNGTLLSKELINACGYPNKSFFIRGDENEYSLRIKSRGFKLITVTNSIVYHPPQSYLILKTSLFIHQFQFLDARKRLYFTRNQILMFKLYYDVKILSLIKRLFLDFFYIIMVQKSFKVLKYFIRGIIWGITQRKRQYDYNGFI